MQVRETDLPGVLIIEPKVFGDQRGFFMETWNQAGYAAAGIPETFVQDNLSLSRKGILRGLHFQNPNAQGKLVCVLQGEVFDVVVDIRVGSPTFGQSINVVLSAENKRQIYIAPGFAHGFCVTSDIALFAYKCTDKYNPQAEASVLWNDPDLNIPWPISNPELSAKDALGIRLADFPRDRLPRFKGWVPEVKHPPLIAEEADFTGDHVLESLVRSNNLSINANGLADACRLVEANGC